MRHRPFDASSPLTPASTGAVVGFRPAAASRHHGAKSWASPDRPWTAHLGGPAGWLVLDWVLAAYLLYVAGIALVWRVEEWPGIALTHAAALGLMLILPARGAAWERPYAADGPWFGWLRATARFLRYTYPALLLTPFFEEVALTVNAAARLDPYWFERYLYAADAALFGGSPAVLLSQHGIPLTDEVMHAFYFSYFPLVIGGIVVAWTGGRRGATPAPGFQRAFTCMMLGFLLSYVWYPFLPARGPWENPALMEGLRPFSGWLFTDAIHVIISNAAVSGGCFPSAHVSGTWAITFGLFATRAKAAPWFAFVAAGLSLSCVYTRYHHGIDVLAGLAVAGLATGLGLWLTRTRD